MADNENILKILIGDNRECVDVLNNFEESKEEVAKMFTLTSKLYWEKYEALIGAKFNDKQAMQILCAKGIFNDFDMPEKEG